MKVKTVFTDFDGTLTHGAELRPIFFDILKFLDSAQIPLVIVTGRSLSWGHFLLSHFSSLQTVIVEGGAIIVDRLGHTIREENLVTDEELVRLEQFETRLLQRFSKLTLSADSWGRKADRAIELADLTQDLSLFEEVKSFMLQSHINFSCSNVHLNFWCGEIDKAKAAKHYLKRHPQISMEECLYFGDSLNDEGMFKNFKNTVGVSNIKPILATLKHHPQVILEGPDQEGPFGVLHYLKSIIE